MAISDAFLQELRSKLEIEDIITPYVSLKRRGRLLTGLCPFHNEKTPSFTVYPESQSFYCFGCGAGGDGITFLRRIENLDYVEAVKNLALRAGMRMPEDGFDDTLIKRRSEILSANREAARFFHTGLYEPEGQKALEYLSGRGISKKTIEHFGLGFARDSWRELLGHLKKKGFSEQVIFEANLARKSEKNGSVNYYDSFRNKVMFPIIDPSGNVIAFGGRVLDDSKPKYINTSDTMVYKKSKGVFALNFAKNGNGGQLILAEGYMDVIALHQAGFTNAIACLGTALTREQANLLARYAEEIILAYDSDEAGQKAAKKAMSIFASTGMKVRVLKLAGGKDPDEIIRKYGKERFASLVNGAASEIEYRILKEREKFDVSTDDGKVSFLNAAADILADLRGEIERDVYATRLAREFSVSKEALLLRVQAKRKSLDKQRERDRIKTSERNLLGFGDKINPERSGNIKAAKAEEMLITSLIRNPDFYKRIKEKITHEDFLTSFNASVFKEICSRLENGKSVELTFLSQSFSPEEMERITKFFISGSLLSNTFDECEDCIKVILNAKNSKESKELSALSDEEYLKLFEKK